LLIAGQAQAGFLITTGNITLGQGSSGFVPVMIQGTGGAQPLDFVGYQFQITTTSGRLLEFQDSPFPDPTFGDSRYVFFGDSADQSVMSGLGFASTTVSPNDTFIGGDFTADGTGVFVPETPTMLLVDLPVTADSALAGDVFTISLVPSVDVSPMGLDGNTGFSAGGTFTPYDSLPGTVTITHSVPEPGGLTLIGLGGLGLLGSTYRRRRRRGQRSPGSTRGYAPAALQAA
jgi:PEP-CTERM motif